MVNTFIFWDIAFEELANRFLFQLLDRLYFIVVRNRQLWVPVVD